MKNKDEKSGSKIALIVVALTLLVTIMMLASFKQGINGESSYITEHNNLDKLKSSVAFDIIYPTFIYDEDNLQISDVMGQIVEVRNSNFVFKASTFVDVNADVLGIYDKLPEDTLYEVEENEAGVHYFRYRCSGKQTLVNWVIKDTAYGLILDRVADIEETKNIIGIHDYKMNEYNEKQGEAEDIASGYQYIEEANLKFKIRSDIDIKTEKLLDEATVCLVDNKPVLIVAYKNLDKYKEIYGDDTETKEYNNAVIFYKTEDMISEEDKSIENYYKTILTIDDVLASVENIK